MSPADLDRAGRYFDALKTREAVAALWAAAGFNTIYSCLSWRALRQDRPATAARLAEVILRRGP